MRRAPAFTLVELLVVIAIIGVLVALLLPAIQAAREAGRRAHCGNNLRQIGLATQQYEMAMKALPASAYISRQPSGAIYVGVLGPHGRILPFIEQGNVQNAMNLDTNYGDLANMTATGRTIATFVCRSEINPKPIDHATFGLIGPTNYGFCMGDWYVWCGVDAAGPDNRSVIGVNTNRRWSSVTDGLSNTLLMSEVKNYQPSIHTCPGLANIKDPNNIPPPTADPLTVCPEYNAANCAFFLNAHTQWAEISVAQNGFTTAWPPNKKTPGGPGMAYPDVDILSIRERLGGPSYAAVTSRSYHPSGVMAMRCDVSVSFVSSNIDGSVWRALGTMDGGEASPSP